MAGLLHPTWDAGVKSTPPLDSNKIRNRRAMLGRDSHLVPIKEGEKGCREAYAEVVVCVSCRLAHVGDI